MPSRLLPPLFLSMLLLAVALLSPHSSPAVEPKTPSNMLRSDYIGASRCADCHAAQAQRWAASPMANMTRLGDTDGLQAPFDGSTFTFKGETVRTETVDGRRLAHLDSARTGERTYRITQVIGGRVREDFAGVDVTDDPTRDPDPMEPSFILPMSWMIGEDGAWRYKGYSVMVKERPGLHVSAEWNRTCVFCHNTVPELSRVLGALHGPGHRGYQGPDLDRKLPQRLRWTWTIQDEEGLKEVLRAEQTFLSTPPAPSTLPTRELIRYTIDATRERLRQPHLVDVGIGCESCHNGGRQHAEDPWVLPPSFLPQSPFLSLTTPYGAEPPRAAAINRSCARCHSVLFSRYPYTWEGGRGRSRTGGSTTNSGEGRDFLLGACSDALTCTACHDPHQKDDPDHLAELLTPAGNPVCTACHPAFAAPDALAAHTHHEPSGSGSACIRCHMPQKNLSLDSSLTTYHRVASPNDPIKLAYDRPLECALCHIDKSVGELADAMENWWPTPVDREALIRLYGGLQANPVDIALTRGAPHEQVVAMHLFADHEDPRALPAIAAQMTHELPAVRYHADQVLQRLLNQPSPVNLHQEQHVIEEEVRRWVGSEPR